MTSREVVLAEHPEAVARSVPREAHACEAYERRAHWEVRSGPGEDARLIAAGPGEESAWAEAAEALRAEVTERSSPSCPPRSPVTRAEGSGVAHDTPRAEPPAQTADAARSEMEGRVAGHAAAGPERIGLRLEELGQRPDPSQAALEAEERCALKALRGDFDGLPALSSPEDRAEVSAFEDEGGRALPPGAESGHDRHDRAAVADALEAARH
jgi:hypothetical protein